MTAKTKSFAAVVKAAEKGGKRKLDPSYRFSGKTFYEKPKQSGKHNRNE
jgi:hypothetical protein